MKTNVILSDPEASGEGSICIKGSTLLSLTNQIRFYPRFYEVNLFYPRQNYPLILLIR
ncbi:hypothetical protein [Flavobacterium araucananum]|uniref:hypothetical protein n=1 Tax=Flavobacterium araucananum TaxID=946678 RepID=UPI001B8854E3|nr:hypothetical protein [Flavobacterium araucananum]